MFLKPYNYRQDISGLRALAVLLTIGYHTFPEFISGGFVGVDIFFVISGFLITKIILENLETNTFNIIDFYSRRIRRIFPALLLLLIACYGIGWFVMFADEYKRLGGHIAAGAGFIQNLVLIQETSYFEKSIDTKPLIHLWSLAIEEQFYLFWPLVIWTLYKKNNLIIGVIIFLGSSFLLNIFTITSNPIMAFYSPLSRVWELIVGSLWACILLYKPEFIKRFHFNTLNFLSVIGLLLIVLATIFLDNKSKFPGWYALLPTVGALFLIIANERSSINQNFLSNSVMVWIGIISYPLYLWHWTLLSFGQVISASTLTSFYKVALIIVSIGLAYWTHRYWENLLRYKGKKVTILLIALMGLIGYQGWSAYVRDGLDFRHKKILDLQGGRPPQTDKGCLIKFQQYDPNFCRLSKENKDLDIVLIGDSIAHNSYSGLEVKYEQLGKNLAMVGWPGQEPTIKESDDANYAPVTSQRMNELITGLAQDKNIKTILLTMRQPEINSLIKIQLERTIEYFEKNGKQVIFIYPPPSLSFEPIGCIGMPPIRPLLNAECVQKVQEIDPQYYIGRVELQKLAVALNIPTYDTYSQICDASNCPLRIDGGLLYRNKAYLTVIGSEKVFSKFLE